MAQVALAEVVCDKMLCNTENTALLPTPCLCYSPQSSVQILLFVLMGYE